MALAIITKCGAKKIPAAPKSSRDDVALATIGYVALATIGYVALATILNGLLITNHVRSVRIAVYSNYPFCDFL